MRTKRQASYSEISRLKAKKDLLPPPLDPRASLNLQERVLQVSQREPDSGLCEASSVSYLRPNESGCLASSSRVRTASQKKTLQGVRQSSSTRRVGMQQDQEKLDELYKGMKKMIQKLNKNSSLSELTGQTQRISRRSDPSFVDRSYNSKYRQEVTLPVKETSSRFESLRAEFVLAATHSLSNCRVNTMCIIKDRLYAGLGDWRIKAVDLCQVPSLAKNRKSKGDLLLHKSETYTLQGHRRGVLALQALPQCGLVFSGGVDTLIKVWRYADNQLLHTTKLHDSAVRDLVALSEEKLASSSQSLLLYDLEHLRVITSFGVEAERQSKALKLHDQLLYCQANTISRVDFRQRGLIPMLQLPDRCHFWAKTSAHQMVACSQEGIWTGDQHHLELTLRTRKRAVSVCRAGGDLVWAEEDGSVYRYGGGQRWSLGEGRQVTWGEGTLAVAEGGQVRLLRRN